jgi:uncharacterized protein DUF4157
MRVIKIISILLALLLSTVANASWLSKITGVDVKVRSSGSSIEINRPQPEAIPEAIQHFPNDFKNFLNPAGTTLAIAIRDARDSVRPGAERMPLNIRQALAPYFPASILDKVRWRTRSQQGFGLDNIVLKVGDADAITLDDTIVFRMGNPASNDIANFELWAHELTHVLQYQNMGIDSFANVYSVNWTGIENQAISAAASIRREIVQGNTQTRFTTNTYSNFASIGTAQLDATRFQQFAMQSIPPQSCIRWQQAPFGANIQNVCNVNMAILGLTKINPYTGQPYNLPCGFNCFLAAGQSMQYNSPQPGTLVNIGFQFVPR